MDTEVCLGCGGIVDPIAADRCTCPPPSIQPRSQTAGPTSYRNGPALSPCPRCRGRLSIKRYLDADVVECLQCCGLFLSKQMVEMLDGPFGGAFRIAFPRRPAPEMGPVSYIPCLACGTRMNRKVFAQISGVIVDVCKEHGVWFDAGEVAAIVAFIDAGGLKTAANREAQKRAQERKALEQQFQVVHAESARALANMYRHQTRGGPEVEALHTLVGLDFGGLFG